MREGTQVKKKQNKANVNSPIRCMHTVYLGRDRSVLNSVNMEFLAPRYSLQVNDINILTYRLNSNIKEQSQKLIEERFKTRQADYSGYAINHCIIFAHKIKGERERTPRVEKKGHEFNGCTKTEHILPVIFCCLFLFPFTDVERQTLEVINVKNGSIFTSKYGQR